eukprot:6801227-Pyramimonas_sp.AAC.1
MGVGGGCCGGGAPWAGPPLGEYLLPDDHEAVKDANAPRPPPKNPRKPKGTDTGAKPEKEKEPAKYNVDHCDAFEEKGKDKGFKYLFAFGPSRHRAWVVGMRPFDIHWNLLGRLLASLLGADSKPLGGRFGANCRFAPPPPLGPPLGPSWGSPSASWSVLWAPRRHLGPSWRLLAPASARLGALL